MDPNRFFADNYRKDQDCLAEDHKTENESYEAMKYRLSETAWPGRCESHSPACLRYTQMDPNLIKDESEIDIFPQLIFNADQTRNQSIK